jgi:coenzyme F420-reducing hydrogenase beta subunit
MRGRIVPSGILLLVIRVTPTQAALTSLQLPTPIDPANWPDRFPAKEHCSKCGLCETTLVGRVVDACAFIGPGMGRLQDMEQVVHGRSRDHLDRFGVLHSPIQLARGAENIKNAQWTGVVTSIAVSMLESGMVDAVVCIGGGEQDDWSSPEPILAKTVPDVLRGRGVKPSLAPSLRLLDEIRADSSIRKLLFCGVGCAVQAFRAVQDELGLDQVYVLGTNCADNSPTPQAAKDFIEKGVKMDSTSVRGYEFMQDFRVHVKTGSDYVKTPYFVLPGTIAEASIAPSCLTCFDYTNGLADVVVGYMGAPLDGRMDQSFQTLTIRNERGAAMVAQSGVRLFGNAEGHGSHEQLASATISSDSIILNLLGDPVPKEGMPRWVGEIMATVMTTVGPKGLHFAKYSIDYHLLRNYLYVLSVWGPERAKICVPVYAMAIVDAYLATDESFQKIRDRVLETRGQNEELRDAA